jgi:hypothetical protein
MTCIAKMKLLTTTKANFGIELKFKITASNSKPTVIISIMREKFLTLTSIIQYVVTGLKIATKQFTNRIVMLFKFRLNRNHLFVISIKKAIVEIYKKH